MTQAIDRANGAMDSVGVIGVGHLGGPMAERLLSAGWTVSVHDSRQEAADALSAKGAASFSTPAGVAREADLIMLVVRTAQDVEDVLFGPDGIAGSARPNALICIVSTIALDDLRRIAERAQEHSLGVIDTTIGGGAPMVERGAAAAMIGGEQDQFDRVAQPFGSFCGDLVHVPGLGGGMRLKLIKNHLSYVTMMVGMEAAMLARAADIELDLVTRVIESSDLLKQFFYLYLDSGNIDPLAEDAPSDQIISSKAMAELCRKDLSAARELAALAGTELPIAEAVEQRAERLFRVPGSDA